MGAGGRAQIPQGALAGGQGSQGARSPDTAGGQGRKEEEEGAGQRTDGRTKTLMVWPEQIPQARAEEERPCGSRWKGPDTAGGLGEEQQELGGAAGKGRGAGRRRRDLMQCEIITGRYDD